MFLPVNRKKTSALLKNIFGWNDLFNFLENFTSRAFLFKSGLVYKHCVKSVRIRVSPNGGK